MRTGYWFWVRGLEAGNRPVALFPVVAVHRRDEAVADERERGLGRRLDGLLHDGVLVLAERCEDVLDLPAARKARADADTEAGKIRRIEFVYDVLHAVVAAGRTLPAQPDLAEVEREVVVDDEGVVRLQAELAEELPDGGPAPVHEVHRLGDGE